MLYSRYCLKALLALWVGLRSYLGLEISLWQVILVCRGVPKSSILFWMQKLRGLTVIVKKENNRTVVNI